ncbi:MAG: hypothetical protein R6T99_00095 [Bacteroidales bacterium]
MNATAITRKLESPAIFSEHEMADLEKIIHEYPFFQMAQILYHVQYALLNPSQKYVHMQAAYAYTRYNHMVDNLYEKIDKDRFHSGRNNTSWKTYLEKDPKQKEKATPLPDTAEKASKPIEKETKPIEKETKSTEKAARPTEKASRPISGDQKKKGLKPMDPERKKPAKEPKEKTVSAPEDRSQKLREIMKKRLEEIQSTEKTPAGGPAKSRTRKKEPKKKPATGMDKKSQSELIEKFIREEPSISRVQGDVEGDIEHAKKSTEENEEIISETLADIHLKQGNTSKAIEIFEQLSLNYPEKSSYFASRIKKIKNNA